MSNVGDTDDMASNALKLLRDDALHAKFKEAAHDKAKQFSKESIIPVYEQLYEDVLESVNS
jgi:glycosyltransferase involved in cell wall biosynthesis